ncbi:hypothetical protein ACNKHM_15955 [Shigella sonnei]
MVFVLPVCQWQQKATFIFYADADFSHKKTRRSGFFRKLFSAGAEAD